MGKEFKHRGNNNCRHYFHLFVFVDIPCFLPSKVLFLSQSHFHLKDTAKNRNTNWAELTKFPSKKNKEKKKGFAWGGDGYLFGLKGRVSESYHCRQRYAVFIFIPFIFCGNGNMEKTFKDLNSAQCIYKLASVWQVCAALYQVKMPKY